MKLRSRLAFIIVLAAGLQAGAPGRSEEAPAPGVGGQAASPTDGAAAEPPAGDPVTTPAAPAPGPAIRNLDEGEHRTLRAGEGFRTTVLGHDVLEQPRNRRSESAFDLGLAAVTPPIRSAEVLPIAALYFWRRPDEDTFLRAIVVGVYNEAEFAKSSPQLGPFEGVLTFNNYTVPVGQAESVDGQKVDDEELLWGRVRGGAGVGWRESLDYQGADKIMNMASVYLVAEPGYLYFGHSDDTADDFVVPQDTFEMRGRLRFRLDHMERNLFELAHQGFVIGSDMVYGWRSAWEDWGPQGSENASGTRDYGAVTGYIAGATGVPFVKGEKHRLLGYLYGGVGSGLDRFSQFRLGGGPSGDEYEAISRALMPGAGIEEFLTDHYVIGIGEYRYEPIFFLYPSLRSSVSYLERRRRVDGGGFDTSNDVIPSVGLRLTSGFAFRTQLQIDYNYSFGVIRNHEYGGHEITIHISGQL